MQTTKIFSIYDSKANAFLTPFFMASAGLAIRAITDLVEDPNHQFNKHSADYTLFQLGEFDLTDGLLSQPDPNTNLGNLLTFKQSTPTRLTPIQRSNDESAKTVEV